MLHDLAISFVQTSPINTKDQDVQATSFDLGVPVLILLRTPGLHDHRRLDRLFHSSMLDVKLNKTTRGIMYAVSDLPSFDALLAAQLGFREDELPVLALVEYQKLRFAHNAIKVFVHPATQCSSFKPKFDPADKQEINDFVDAYFADELVPAAKTEDIEQTFARFPGQRRMFDELSIQKINSKELLRLAHHHQAHNFIVVECAIWSQVCIDHLYEIHSWHRHQAAKELRTHHRELQAWQRARDVKFVATSRDKAKVRQHLLKLAGGSSDPSALAERINDEDGLSLFLNQQTYDEMISSFKPVHRPIKLYFMDSQHNSVYHNTMEQGPPGSATGFGIYFKQTANLFSPEPRFTRHGTIDGYMQYVFEDLDGLKKIYQLMDVNTPKK